MTRWMIDVVVDFMAAKPLPSPHWTSALGDNRIGEIPKL